MANSEERAQTVVQLELSDLEEFYAFDKKYELFSVDDAQRF